MAQQSKFVFVPELYQTIRVIRTRVGVKIRVEFLVVGFGLVLLNK